MEDIVRKTICNNTQIDCNDRLRILCWDGIKTRWVGVSLNHEQNLQADVKNTTTKMQSSRTPKRLCLEKNNQSAISTSDNDTGIEFV
uniref:Uncharacterized protein n=1 Tax=Nesodiprion zhejiangensis nucleopolyhedrovirus TaxID=3135970 RepID=A0AAN0LWB0_9BACU